MGIGIKMAGHFYIEGKTEELLRRDKNAQKINMCNQYANFAHICTNMCRELCKKLCKEIISHAHREAGWWKQTKNVNTTRRKRDGRKR